MGARVPRSSLCLVLGNAQNPQEGIFILTEGFANVECRNGRREHGRNEREGNVTHLGSLSVNSCAQ